MTSPLLHFVNTLIAPPTDEAEKLQRIATTASLKKGELFIRAGMVPQKFAFVSSGLFRYFYCNEKGSEFTKGFFTENNFIVSYSAMAQQQPSYFTIEALEDSTLAVIDLRDWKELFNGHPCWTKLLLALLEKGYTKKEARERDLLLLNAEERYRGFLQEYPYLESRIKQHMIASYLGITPVALSRIRKGSVSTLK